VKIESRRRQGAVLTTVEASHLEDLALARQRLAPLLGSRQVQLSQKQMSLVNSKNGSRQVAIMEQEMNIKMHVDDRQSAVIIYADDGELAAEAERTLMELLCTKIGDVAKDISLRGVEYPRGLMKALVIQ